MFVVCELFTDWTVNTGPHSRQQCVCVCLSRVWLTYLRNQTNMLHDQTAPLWLLSLPETTETQSDSEQQLLTHFMQEQTGNELSCKTLNLQLLLFLQVSKQRRQRQSTWDWDTCSWNWVTDDSEAGLVFVKHLQLLLQSTKERKMTYDIIVLRSNQQQTLWVRSLIIRCERLITSSDRSIREGAERKTPQFRHTSFPQSVFHLQSLCTYFVILFYWLFVSFQPFVEDKQHFEDTKIQIRTKDKTHSHSAPRKFTSSFLIKESKLKWDGYHCVGNYWQIGSPPASRGSCQLFSQVCLRQTDAG